MGDLVIQAPIVRKVGNRAVTSSKDVATYFGKEPEAQLNFQQGFYTLPSTGPQQHRCLDMTRDGFTLLAMGFTGAKALKFKLAYIAEFNAMEEALKEPRPVSTEIAQLAATVAQTSRKPLRSPESAARVDFLCPGRCHPRKGPRRLPRPSLRA